MEVRFLEEQEFSTWRAFVDAAPAGSVYSYPEYLDVLCSVVGGSFRVLAAFRGEEIQGGIALYERRSRGGLVLSGRFLLFYNGLVLKRFESKYPSENMARELKILAALEAALAAIPHGHTEIQSRHPVADLRPFLAAGWAARPGYSLLLDFLDLDAAYGRIHQNQRRLIRRCAQSGAQVSPEGDFDAFYRLHRATHERKGAPLYLPEPKFRRYVEGVRGRGLGRIYEVRMPDGTVAASQLVLTGSHPETHTVTAGADPDYLHFGVTPFLRWEVCRSLASEGHTANDLTGAYLNPVMRFKSQLGAKLVTNLVLTRPDRLRFRIVRQGRRIRQKARSALGRAYRVLRHGAS